MNKHYDVFISYSRKDYVDENKNVIPGNVVSTLKNLLKENQISYWFDEDGIYSGDTFAEKIASNIENASVLLFISSESSNASKWTSKEIAAASMWKKKIIPVRIDNSPYNKSVMLYIADLDYVDYMANPEKAKEIVIESIKNQIEKEKLAIEQEKRAEEMVRQKHRQQQDSLYRELAERIIRYNTEQKILQSSYQSIHKDIEHLDNADKQLELRQMFISQDKIGAVDNEELVTLRKRNRLLATENEKLREELSTMRLKAEMYEGAKQCIVDADTKIKGAFETLFKAPIGFWFTFRGSIGRGVFALAQFVIAAIVINLSMFVVITESGIIGVIWLLLAGIGSLSSLSFCIRRCRDVGKKWYWILIPCYVFVLMFEKGQEK